MGAFECQHCGKIAGNAVPEERFKEVNDKAKQLEKELAGVSSQATLAEKHATKVEELKAELESVRSNHAIELAMSDAGITDPEVRSAFEWQYSKVETPPEGGFGEWLDGLKNDPDTAPVVLRSFIKSDEQPKSEDPKPPSRQPGKTSTSTGAGGPSQPPPAGRVYEQGDIRRIIREGGVEAYKAQRDAIHEARGLPPPPKRE